MVIAQLVQFFFLAREGKSISRIWGIAIAYTSSMRASRVCEHTILFFLANISKPPRHEFLGFSSSQFGRKLDLSMVTLHLRSSLPSKALTSARILSLYV